MPFPHFKTISLLIQVLGRTVQRGDLLPGHRQQHDIDLRHRETRSGPALGHETQGSRSNDVPEACSSRPIKPGVQRRLRHEVSVRRPRPVPQPRLF